MSNVESLVKAIKDRYGEDSDTIVNGYLISMLESMCNRIDGLSEAIDGHLEVQLEHFRS